MEEFSLSKYNRLPCRIPGNWIRWAVTGYRSLLTKGGEQIYAVSVLRCGERGRRFRMWHVRDSSATAAAGQQCGQRGCDQPLDSIVQSFGDRGVSLQSLGHDSVCGADSRPNRRGPG